MSEVTETRNIERVQSARAEREAAGFPVGAILAALGKAAVVCTKAAAKGAAATARVSWLAATKVVEKLRAADAAATAADLTPLPPSMRAAVESAPDLQGALHTLAAAGARLSSPDELTPFIEQVHTALTVQDAGSLRAALRDLADETMAQHQRLIADHALQHADATVRGLGFETVRMLPERGYLLAERVGGESLRVDVVRLADGCGVSIVTDADGFEGEECVATTSAFHEGMRNRGVKCEFSRRVRKPGIPMRNRGARARISC